MPDPIKLNIGAGGTDIPGYTPVDIKDGVLAHELPYEDGTVDTIRASHVLEHYSHRDVSAVINHWVQKLGPGGVLKIAVPDLRKVYKRYDEGEPINIQGYLMGGHTDGDDHHGCIFDDEMLAELMVNAGLERIGVWKSEINDCASLPISLNLCGYKPCAPITELKNVAAVLGSARFCPAMHHRCAWEALGSLGIPYRTIIGCYWHELMCMAIEAQIAKPNIEYVLTCDYDTIFCREDVMELYRLVRAYDVDAVCSVQSKRNAQEALFTICNSDWSIKKRCYKADFNRNLTQVTTGHFGLTIFRADTLRSFPRPWMVGSPGEDGKWDGKGKVDPDIDFWKRWQEAGLKLHVANRVIVGHLEEVITWPDPDYKPVHQNVSDYLLGGKPKEIHR